MKPKSLLLLFACCICFGAKAQLNQRFDNINYKALYFGDAVKLINNTPGLLLLDVRSPGEYADTSQSTTLNIGRLKGSINIPIDSIKNHLKDLEPYKNKPILVYCSHSQRSRVVSKLLTDNGFTNVSSLNGGMSLVNKSTDKEFTLKPKLLTSNLPYKLIQSDDAHKFIADKNNLVIDLRPVSQFNGTDTIPYLNIGHIKNALNIPLADIDKKVEELSKFKQRPIMFYGLNGQDGVTAAIKFSKAGFTNIYALFEGLITFMPNTPSKARAGLFVTTTKYISVGPKETISLVTTKPGLVIADVRPKAEFENKSKNNFQNLGHIINANNYTMPGLVAYMAGKPKSTPVLVYGSSMQGPNDAQHDVAIVCKQLADQGFTNVYFLYNNLYGLVWTVTNVEDCKSGMAILTDHNGLY